MDIRNEPDEHPRRGPDSHLGVPSLDIDASCNEGQAQRACVSSPGSTHRRRGYPGLSHEQASTTPTALRRLRRETALAPGGEQRRNPFRVGLLWGDLTPGSPPIGGKPGTMSRYLRVNPPPGSPNLPRFKQEFRKHQHFKFVPVLGTQSAPAPAFDFAIEKYRIGLKQADALAGLRTLRFWRGVDITEVRSA